MARVIVPAGSRFTKDRSLAKPVLLTTQLINGVPARGRCSACDKEFHLANNGLSKALASSDVLRAVFEQHIQEKHAESGKDH